MGISRAEALDALRSDDLIGLGMEADALRRRLHPEGVATYAVEGVLRCGAEDAETLTRRAAELLGRGASGLRLVDCAGQGMEPLVHAISALRGAAPACWIAVLEPAEVSRLAGSVGEISATLERLRDAGLDALVPAGVDLAAEASDVHLGEWLAIHRAAHRAGLTTTAALRFGAGETPEQRVAALVAIHELQAQTGGFSAFVPEPAATGLHGPTAVDSLRTLAVARLVLSNIPTVEFGSVYGLKVLEVGLCFGANDAGAVTVGTRPDLAEEDLRRVIRHAGLQPVERDLGYRMLFVA